MGLNGLQKLTIRIRPVGDDDCYDLWHWRNSPEVRKSCFNADEIPYDAHEKWFKASRMDDRVCIYIAEGQHGEKIGQVRFQQYDCEEATININLNPQYTGKGLGSQIINEATRVFFEGNPQVRRIIAEILVENIPSIKSFQRVGFELCHEEIKRDKKMVVYMLKRD